MYEKNKRIKRIKTSHFRQKYFLKFSDGIKKTLKELIRKIILLGGNKLTYEYDEKNKKFVFFKSFRLMKIRNVNHKNRLKSIKHT